MPRRKTGAKGTRMATYAILLLLGAAACAGAPNWLIPVAAAGLTLAEWKPWRLERHVRAPWSLKSTTYLVTGVIAHLLLAAIAFGVGQMLRYRLG